MLANNDIPFASLVDIAESIKTGAASSAAVFLANELTVPDNVTTPFLTATPISLAFNMGSHLSSSITSF